MIEIYIDSDIWIQDLSKDWVIGLSKLVSVKNEEKQTAIREKVWGAHKMDDYLTMAHYDSETKILSLSRGFLPELVKLLKDNDLDFKIFDKTTWYREEPYTDYDTPTLSGEQSGALVAMLTHDTGRIIMPPGKGKTVLGLSAALDTGATTLIICQQKHIAQQWVDNAKKHFGVDIGFIGDGKFNEKKITVALIQTLWSRRYELDEYSEEEGRPWWEFWDMVILDEQHHIPANTFSDVVQRTTARKRFGLSATIGKTEAQARISELVFGPILYESKEVNVKPIVKVIDTEFEFDYHPTKEYIKDNGKKGIRRNNYKDLVKALVEDDERNMKVAYNIWSDPEACHLIVSDRLAHLDNIIRQLWLIPNEQIHVYKLTGKESLDERMEVYGKADKGNCAIFSTVASEALDIPRIDRIHIAYPRSNVEAIWQIIGRGTRAHPEKVDSVIIDYRDKKCSILYNQYSKRVGLYREKNLDILSP